jgi:hypothetical protein
MLSGISEHVATVVLPGSMNPNTIAKANPTAIVDGESANSVPLVSESIPYSTAVVTARTGSVDEETISTPNTNSVYILTTGDDLTTAWMPLMPGQSMPLPCGADLADFHLAVVTAGEGVLISYTN